MAMSNEELHQQMNILTTRTDNNPDMEFEINAAINKGLDPKYFTGNNTSIVNALNQLADDARMTNEVVKDMAVKINDIMLDVSGDENRLLWEKVKELMEDDTVIDGLHRILEGKQQDKILGITPEDIGKILVVDQNPVDGEMMVKAIDSILKVDVEAEEVRYFNPDHNSITNVSEALDMIFNNIEDSGILDNLQWDMIKDKPEIPNRLELTENELVLRSDEGDMSSVDLVSNDDIDDILSEL